MEEGYPISTNLLGRTVVVNAEYSTRNAQRGELVGIHRQGCNYIVLVLHDDGIVESYALHQITLREGVPEGSEPRSESAAEPVTSPARRLADHEQRDLLRILEARPRVVHLQGRPVIDYLRDHFLAERVAGARREAAMMLVRCIAEKSKDEVCAALARDALDLLDGRWTDHDVQTEPMATCPRCGTDHAVLSPRAREMLAHHGPTVDPEPVTVRDVAPGPYQHSFDVTFSDGSGLRIDCADECRKLDDVTVCVVDFGGHGRVFKADTLHRWARESTPHDRAISRPVMTPGEIEKASKKEGETQFTFTRQDDTQKGESHA